MQQQYQNIKAQAPGAILFFRLGDFYEMFGEDAEIAAPVLGIALTSREAGQGTRIPMCGVPYHALEGYLVKMVNAGFRVAICEQTEDPASAKGIVKREIVRIVTRGTLLEGEQEGARHAFVACVFFHNKTWGLAYADLTTGAFNVFQTPYLPHLQAELSRVAPLELMLSEELTGRDALWSDWFVVYQDKSWFHEREEKVLLERFPDQADMLQRYPVALRAASALWRHINVCLPGCRQDHFIKIGRRDTDLHMLLDRWTRRNLELTETLRGGDSETLFGTLNFTLTAPGGRLLKLWVGAPLLERGAIEQRLDMVEVFVRDSFLRDDMGALLRQVYDLERLLSRLTYGKATARDLLLLGQTLGLMPEVCRLLEGLEARSGEVAACLDGYRKDMEHLTDLSEELCRALDPDAPATLKEGQMILPGYVARVDELRVLTDGGKEFLVRLENRERERTRIRSLKIGYNKVFGYYLEISNANKHLIPEEYERKQTLVNAERYITPELKDYESKILTAQEELTELEYQIFSGLKEQTLRQASAILRATNALAEIDVFLALAQAAVRYHYVRPTLRDDGVIKIRDGRHPVVERMGPKVLAGGFVPNDTELSPDRHFALITGPNMAGKSTYMRQVALITLMAQMGSFVPARSASLSLVDGIFTRIGASDDVAAGQSTFLVEMTEVAYILRYATAASLLIFDEVGRGTSTFDGMSLAWAIAEHIAENPALGSKTLFATHYHQMTVLDETHPAVFNLHVAVEEKGRDIVFLHKILPGRAEGSYGLYVARLAGVSPAILDRAETLLQELEDESMKASAHDRPCRVDRTGFAQPSLFVTPQEHPVLLELRRANPDMMTPREALEYLYELVRKAKE